MHDTYIVQEGGRTMDRESVTPSKKRGNGRALAIAALVATGINIAATMINTWATVVNNIVTAQNTKATLKNTKSGGRNDPPKAPTKLHSSRRRQRKPKTG